MTADDRVVLRDHELVELLGDEPELLAILDAYAATQRRYWHETTRRRNRLVWALAAALALICAGGALAYAIVAGPLHNATLIPDATGPGACQLIGKTAADASTYFGAQGVTIWWRFSHWPSSSAPATARQRLAKPRWLVAGSLALLRPSLPTASSGTPCRWKATPRA